jgi:hypothetical protein
VEQNRRRVPRFRCFASAELVDEGARAKNRARVIELSLYGCCLETANPWPVGNRDFGEDLHRHGIF